VDWRSFFGRRRKLWAFGGFWLGVGLAGLDVFFARVTYIPQYAVRNDFRLMYGAALATLRHGYGHLYDLTAQRAAVEGIGPGFYWSPFLNPPPLVWLVTPFTALPFTVAIWAWTVLILGALLLTWYLVAPGAGLTKAAHGALWLGVLPVAFGVMVGQPVALVAAAVAACWWFAERDRPALAGLALSLIVFKPQLAILVPLCLVVAGHGRVFGAWLLASIFIGLVSLALLGHDGLARYLDVLNIASGWQITRGYAVSGLIGTGPQLYVAQALAVAGAVGAAWRWRMRGTGLPIAAGITASLLFTPYVGFQDFALLVVAGWLVAREQPSASQVALLAVGYALLEFALVVLAIPILIAEVLLLASLIWIPAGRLTRPPSEIPARAPA
jgi:hypothetical protein